MPIRNSIRSNVIPIDMTAFDVSFTEPINYALYTAANDGGQANYNDASSFDRPYFSAGVNTFPADDEYTLEVGFNNGVGYYVHGTQDDFADQGGTIKLIDDRLIIDISTSNNLREYSVKAPTLTAGAYDPGSVSVDYSIDTSSYAGAGATLYANICEMPGHSDSVFNYGSIWLDATPSFLVAIVGVDQGLYNAFNLDGIVTVSPDTLSTISDATTCYTYAQGYDGITLYNILTEWVPTVAPGFSYTNYTLQLDDVADDALFATFEPNGFWNLVVCNGKWIFSYQVDFPCTQMTAFVFNADMSSYERYDIISDGSLGGCCFMIDVDGNYWLTGYDNVSGDMLSYMIAPVTVTPTFTVTPTPIAIACQTYCVPLIRRK